MSEQKNTFIQIKRQGNRGPIRAVRKKCITTNGLWPLGASPRPGSTSPSASIGATTSTVWGVLGSSKVVLGHWIYWHLAMAIGAFFWNLAIIRRSRKNVKEKYAYLDFGSNRHSLELEVGKFPIDFMSQVYCKILIAGEFLYLFLKDL